MVDVTGLDPVDVLRALYDHATPMAFGHNQYRPGPLGLWEAQTALRCSKNGYIDKIFDRKIGIYLVGNNFNPAVYDAANGLGTAEAVIGLLRAQKAA